MSCWAGPDWSLFLNAAWGPQEDNGPGMPGFLIGLASNIVVGTNPGYTVQDFLSQYPQFGGKTAKITGTAVADSNQITGVNQACPNLTAGNPVSDPSGNFPDGTVITAISASPGPYTVTLSNPATQSGSVTLTVWNRLPVPASIISLFVALASASLIQARWQEFWTVAMGLYVAHYLTLWLRAYGQGADSTPQQVVSNGLALAIQVSKGVGDVSVGYQAITSGWEDWGAWNLTLFGQQLITLAKFIGSGPVLLY